GDGDPQDPGRGVLERLPFLHERERKHQHHRHREKQRGRQHFEALRLDCDVLPKHEERGTEKHYVLIATFVVRRSWCGVRVRRSWCGVRRSTCGVRVPRAACGVPASDEPRTTNNERGTTNPERRTRTTNAERRTTNVLIL